MSGKLCSVEECDRKVAAKQHMSLKDFVLWAKRLCTHLQPMTAPGVF